MTTPFGDKPYKVVPVSEEEDRGYQVVTRGAVIWNCSSKEEADRVCAIACSAYGNGEAAGFARGMREGGFKKLKGE